MADAEGRILGHAAPGAAAATDWERFPGEIWTAAPVLAHAHLDGWDAPAGRFRRAPFAGWIRDLLEWREGSDRLSSRASASAASARLAETGCGLAAAHVGGAEAAGAPDSALELLAWREVLDPFPVDGGPAAHQRWLRAMPPCAGLALHAPYTVELALAREIFARARGAVSLHLAESEEERMCLATGRGPLAELLAERRGRRPEGGYSSPVAWLASAGGMRRGTLAVHATNLTVEELHALARAGVSTVFCPGTHRWFGRPEPRFAAAGLFPSALGCDSRASNEDLDPLREFRLALRLLPAWKPEDAWHALTAGGARAIGRPGGASLAAGSPLRALRLRDARAVAAAAGEPDAPRRGAALLRWLASCEDPTLAGARIPAPDHAISG